MMAYQVNILPKELDVASSRSQTAVHSPRYRIQEPGAPTSGTCGTMAPRRHGYLSVTRAGGLVTLGKPVWLPHVEL